MLIGISVGVVIGIISVMGVKLNNTPSTSKVVQQPASAAVAQPRSYTIIINVGQVPPTVTQQTVTAAPTMHAQPSQNSGVGGGRDRLPYSPPEARSKF